MIIVEPNSIILESYTEPPSVVFTQLLSITHALTPPDALLAAACGIVVLTLILCSAIISSSENAFFSLSKQQAEWLSEENSRASSYIAYLVQHPKKLLATILITNTFVNIAIVMVSSLLIGLVFDFGTNAVLSFLIEVILVTFMIVLFGEVIPKIYASQNNEKLVRLLAIPMYILSKVFAPFVYILEKSTSIIDKRVTKKGHVLSVDELTHAIDITAEKDTPKQEKTILKSIVNFGNIHVKQIMRLRPDISALDIGMNSTEVIDKINDWGYSRVPVYQNNLDQITGILYIKDLLPYLYNTEPFEWQQLVRKPYFVPESKKIDDLLKDFQSKRVHLAIVVDEFGGTSGIVTMEDILEEIFGEIHDEFDEDELFYTRIDDKTYVFEAKMLINDMCKLMEVNTEVFDEVRNEADTIGGMLLEVSGDLPDKGEQITIGEFRFTIESVDQRKIKRVKVEIIQA
ncbi:MAG: gliding motility-associated protein GldE [Bacteroidia bacterium]|nr:gliding motility-associated protein GldE [Bacteroidia bacterium]